MRVCGIIAEYDPFHRGHLHHLSEARRLAQADFVVCVLSTAFTQRGLPGLFSTHDRARMALQSGADLVLGMPVSASCAQANRFAMGGVGTLQGLGVVTHLSFGVESAALPYLEEAARLLHRDDEALGALRRQGLQQGKSFARAQGEALSQVLRGVPPALLSQPNFVLGTGYLQAMLSLGAAFELAPVPRMGSYHDTSVAPLPSATAVRQALLRGDWQGVARAVPHESLQVIQEAVWQGQLHRPEGLDRVLLHHLLTQGVQPGTAEISEGLEQRILQKARQAGSRAELVELVKSKRYPHARISRALSSALLGLCDAPPAPPAYARMLGFRKRAAPLLTAIKRSGFPLFDRPARSNLPGIAQDMRAEELWHVGAGLHAQQAWQQQTIIIP